MSTITVEQQNMRETGRAILICLLVIQVVVVFAILEPFSITWRSPSNVPVSVSAPASDLPLTLESGEATAAAIARTWRDEPRLVSAVMQVDWPTESATEVTADMPFGGWIIYTFLSGQSTLSVMFDRKSGAFITSADGESGNDAWPMLELQGHARSSTTALLTADLLEGSAFRNACPSSRSSALVTLSSAPDDTGEQRSVWTVTYGDSRYPATFDVLVRLDADTGNVLTTERRDRPCNDNVIS